MKGNGDSLFCPEHRTNWYEFVLNRKIIKFPSEEYRYTTNEVWFDGRLTEELEKKILDKFVSGGGL